MEILENFYKRGLPNKTAATICKEHFNIFRFGLLQKQKREQRKGMQSQGTYYTVIFIIYYCVILLYITKLLSAYMYKDKGRNVWRFC